MFDFTFGGSAANLPEGSYFADWIGVEPFESQNKEYGPSVKWSFRITQGEHSGKTISRITGTKPTPNNGCGKIIVALLGRTPKEGEGVNLETLVGKRYLCQVVKGQNGGCRIENVTAMPS